jgi:hypothetical protein
MLAGVAKVTVSDAPPFTLTSKVRVSRPAKLVTAAEPVSAAGVSAESVFL